MPPDTGFFERKCSSETCQSSKAGGSTRFDASRQKRRSLPGNGGMYQSIRCGEIRLKRYGVGRSTRGSRGCNFDPHRINRIGRVVEARSLLGSTRPQVATTESEPRVLNDFRTSSQGSTPRDMNKTASSTGDRGNFDGIDVRPPLRNKVWSESNVASELSPAVRHVVSFGHRGEFSPSESVLVEAQQASVRPRTRKKQF